MRIGIDARFYGSTGKGLGRYTEKLIQNLEKIDAQGGNQYFIFLSPEGWAEYRPQNKNFHPILADYKWYSLAEQLYLPGLLNKYHLDLVHFPHFRLYSCWRGYLCFSSLVQCSLSVLFEFAFGSNELHSHHRPAFCGSSHCVLPCP